MNAQALINTAKTQAADETGLLTMGESHLTGRKQFGRLGIFQTGRACLKLIATKLNKIL
jgi:hypothetical protein